MVRELGSPWRFAEVAVIGPDARASARATGWSGTRNPIVARPPTLGANTRRASADGVNSTVNGPGRCRRRKRRAAGETRAYRSISSVELTQTEIGCEGERPFAARSLRTAPR